MKISIIIPVYNSANSIISTLESVRHQSYKNFEIIIIDDGSQDLSVHIINDYIDTYRHLDIKMISQKNQGVSKARNVGIKMATGSWIALLDSDDKWAVNKLERQLQILNSHPSIDFLGANRKGEHFNTFLNIKFNVLTKISSKILLYKNFFVTSTIIFKKDIVKEIGLFDENQRYCEDAKYFIEIANKKQSYLLNESLVSTGNGEIHFQEKGLSSNLWGMQKGEIKNLNFALKNKIINLWDYFLMLTFSFLKYFRRIWMVFKMNLNSNNSKNM